MYFANVSKYCFPHLYDFLLFFDYEKTFALADRLHSGA